MQSHHNLSHGQTTNPKCNIPQRSLLHINPGAAGLQGWHKDRTLIRLTIDGKEFKDLEVITLGD